MKLGNVPITTSSTGSALPSAAVAQLAKSIEAKLKSGASLTDVVNQLAASLATSVAAQLGVTTAAGLAQLQAAFAQALSPPQPTGPPSPSTADQAQTLAQRFADAATIATRVATNGDSGQLNRFVGNNLDAVSAKVTPAQVSTASGTPQATGSGSLAKTSSPDDAVARAIASAQSQLLQLTTPATLAQTQAVQTQAVQTVAAGVASLPQASLSNNPVTIAAAAAGDGKVVQLASAQALAAGGATPLGRILARAANVAAANETTTASTDQVGTDAAAPSSDSAVGLASRGPVDAVAATFVKAFEAAAAAADATNGSTKLPTDAPPAAALLASSTNDAVTVPAYLPSAPTFHVAVASAQPASSPAPAYVDANSVVDQVLQGAFLKTVGPTTSQIRISLVPQSLGDVSVKLTVNASGTVDAHVIAQTPEARDALVAGTPQLTRALSDAGLKLTSFSVDVNSGGFAGYQQQQQQQQSAQQRTPFGSSRALLGGIDAVEGGEETALLAVPTFGPPLVAGQSLGAYNYLA